MPFSINIFLCIRIKILTSSKILWYLINGKQFILSVLYDNFIVHHNSWYLVFNESTLPLALHFISLQTN